MSSEQETLNRFMLLLDLILSVSTGSGVCSRSSSSQWNMQIHKTQAIYVFYNKDPAEWEMQPNTEIATKCSFGNKV